LILKDNFEEILMEEKNKLPEDYLPFSKIIICSNAFIGGKYIIEVNINVPLLIGKGILPLVWLSIPLSDNKWSYIIERNISHHPNIIVELSTEKHSVIIKIREGKIKTDKVIINIYKETEDSIIIKQIDLRPMGLDIYGNEDGLNVGTNIIKNSNFLNVNTMIGIGN
jgi:hypothetical protein